MMDKAPVGNVGPADNPTQAARADVKGPECPKCGDRFPSKETLDEHMDEAHKLTS